MQTPTTAIDEKAVTKLTLQNFEFAVIGEFICAFLLMVVFYQVENILIIGWFFFECLNLISQLLMVLSYKSDRYRLPVNYLNFYRINITFTIVLYMLLPFLYPFVHHVTLFCIGLAYVSLISGGTIFHCYIRYIHILYAFGLLASYAIHCFSYTENIHFLGYGTLILFVSVASASLSIHLSIRYYLRLAYNNEQKVNDVAHYNKIIDKRNQKLLAELEKKQKLEQELLRNNDLLLKINAEYEEKNKTAETIFSTLFNTIDLGVLLVENGGRDNKFNPVFQAFFPEASDNINAILTLFPQQTADNYLLLKLFPLTLGQGKQHSQLKLVTKDNRQFRLSLIIIKREHQVKNIWIFEDVTQITQEISDSEQHAQYDQLTGLANRNLLFDKISQLSAPSRQLGQLFAVVFIDLDDFKFINDTLGHEVGNDVLRLFAKKLSSFQKKHIFAGRMSGDEFLIIVSGLNYKQDIMPLLNRLKEEFTEKLIIDEFELFLSISIGASFFPSDATSSSELVHLADIAMYESKSKGKNKITLFHPDLIRHKNQDVIAKYQLRRNILEKRFNLTYQPIVSMKQGDIHKYEILITSQDDQQAKSLFDVAEEYNLMHDIVRHMVRQSSELRQQVCKTLPDNIKFVINISASQLYKPAFITDFFDFFELNQIPGNWFEFELNGNAMMYEKNVAQFIDTARTLNISVSLGNFGVGYSSISALRSLSIDAIKIDKKLLHMSESPKNHRLLQASVNLARNICSAVSIDGVDNQSYYQHCQQLAIDYIQGDFILSPLSENELVPRQH